MREALYLDILGGFILGKQTTIKINEVTYPLATTLRVAYVLQGMHNHKNYMKIFEDIGDMPIEGQIGVLYAAYEVACAGTPMSKEEFRDLCLDNLDLSEIMNGISEIIEGITGKKLKKEAEKLSSSEDSAEESESAKN